MKTEKKKEEIGENMVHWRRCVHILYRVFFTYFPLRQALRRRRASTSVTTWYAPPIRIWSSYMHMLTNFDIKKNKNKKLSGVYIYVLHWICSSDATYNRIFNKNTIRNTCLDSSNLD